MHVAKHTIKIVQVLHYTSNGMSFFKLQSTWFLVRNSLFLMTPKTFILVFTNDSDTTKKKSLFHEEAERSKEYMHDFAIILFM